MITSSEVLSSEREWLQRCFQTIDSKNTCPQFGYLRGDNFADRNVPAGEIKIDCRAFLTISVPVKAMKSRGLKSAKNSVKHEKIR